MNDERLIAVLRNFSHLDCVKNELDYDVLSTERDYCTKIFSDAANRIEALLCKIDGLEANIVVEVCPHCDMEVEMKWSVEMFGYKAYCPYCGQRLMLCDECQHPNGKYEDNCDYCTETDSCRFNRTEDCNGKTR